MNKQITPHQQAALNYKEHISLTANAGSGKTFVLSNRFVDIAVNENISLRNIVAITFTEKAAGELYSKISKEINERLDKSDNEKEKVKLERIRRQLVSANISTIHSFCIDLLKQYPLEAQLDANFTAMDNELSEEFIQLSIEEAIQSAISDPAKLEQVKYLIRIFSSKTLLTNSLADMIRNRKNVIKLKEGLYSKNQIEIADFFYKKYESTIKQILRNRIEPLKKVLLRINSTVLENDPANQIAREAKFNIERLNSKSELDEMTATLIRIRELMFTSANKIRKQNYLSSGREDISEEIEAAEKFFKDSDLFELPEDHSKTENELAAFGLTMMDLFSGCYNIYTEKKRINRCLDFEDILLLTKSILKDPNVIQSIKGNYKYIMVDEYQDTNETQYEIFLPLLDNLREGNLFVVGDEKQSIYMFRDAELEIFDRTKKEISKASGEKSILNLPDSFRMSPAICLFTNRLFRNIFDEPDILFNEVEYSELVCARNDSVKGTVELQLAEKDNSELSEADMVAQRIIQIVNEDKVEFGEIAILCRKRKSFDELEKTFNKYKIPFNILGGKGFYQRQTIYDIHNYLCFLQNQDNNSALIGILRSPFFLMSDAEIFEMSLEKKFTFWENLRSYSYKSEIAKKIYDQLVENISDAKNLNITSVIRKILRESGYLTVIASGLNGEQEIANLDKLIELSNNFANIAFKTPYDFLVYLEDSIKNYEDESQPALDVYNNSVKIMTIHQAKGLEYKAVFLFNCNDISSQDISKSKSVTISKEFGLLTSVPADEGYFGKYLNAPIVNLHNYIQRKKNLAEIKRLLYVAVTRAKDHLIISASHNDLNFPKTSFMDLILRSLEPDLNDEEYIIRDELNFLSSDLFGFSNDRKQISLHIPIIKKTDENELQKNTISELNSKKLILGEIEDSQEDEIISATKISVFNQCSLKYQLTYELGYMKIFSEFKNSTIEFYEKEEEAENHSFSDVKGKVIHKILEENKPDYQQRIETLLAAEIDLNERGTEKMISLQNEICSDLERYFKAEAYRELLQYPDYKNEMEVYAREKDYFLYGIIDKLIISGTTAKIIDYKTDNIAETDIEERSLNYFSQLKFYAYLIQKLYRNINNFELNLVFIKPAKKTVMVLNKEDVIEFGNQISDIVKRIREKKFPKNTSHCPYCVYSKNYKCIKA